MKTKPILFIALLTAFAGRANAQGFGLGASTPTELLHLYKTGGDAAIRFQSGTGSSTAGPSNPGTQANDASTGSIAWSSASNVAGSDNAYATAGSGTSQYLKATNFGFAIPAGATIDGIKVEVEQQKSSDNPALLDNWSTTSLSGVTSSTTLAFTNSAGSNRVLILMIGAEESGNTSIDISSVTYGGQTMTQAIQADANVSFSNSRSELFYLNESGLASAGTGSKNFVVNYSGGDGDGGPDDITLAAATFQYVNQSTLGTVTGSNLTTTSADPMNLSATVASAVGDVLVLGGTANMDGTAVINNAGGETYTETEITAPSQITSVVYHSFIASAGTEQPGVDYSSAPNNRATLVAMVLHKSTATVYDNIVKLVKSDGTIAGSDLAATTTDWPTSDAYATYGSTSSLWGLSWTDTDINDADFGVAVSVTASNATARVDHIRITVYYTTSGSMVNFAAGIDQSDAGKFKISGSSALGTSDRLIIDASGNVGIGTNPSTTLHVNGTIRGSVIQATTAGAGAFQYNTSSNMTVPDYVFDKYFDKKSKENPVYSMMTLEELEAYIARNRHLPRVPSRREIEADGIINTQAMSMITLEKVEELTLYVIEQKNRITEQRQKMEKLQKENDAILKSLEKYKNADYLK